MLCALCGENKNKKKLCALCGEMQYLKMLWRDQKNGGLF